MTGDRYSNNSCILSYADGSPISFACGSLGSVCMCSKEYMEVFGKDVVITVSEFIDMRVRGIPGEFDQIYPPHMNERAEEVLKYGYDFYETYKGVEMMQYVKTYKDLYNIDLEYVRRPYSSALNPDNMKFELQNPDLWSFQPDKGWIESFEHFAKAFLEGKEPLNADGSAGKLTTDLALKLLESREKGQALDF